MKNIKLNITNTTSKKIRLFWERIHINYVHSDIERIRNKQSTSGSILTWLLMEKIDA